MSFCEPQQAQAFYNVLNCRQVNSECFFLQQESTPSGSRTTWSNNKPLRSMHWMIAGRGQTTENRLLDMPMKKCAVQRALTNIIICCMKQVGRTQTSFWCKRGGTMVWVLLVFSRSQIHTYKTLKQTIHQECTAQ